MLSCRADAKTGELNWLRSRSVFDWDWESDKQIQIIYIYIYIYIYIFIIIHMICDDMCQISIDHNRSHR